MKNMHDHDFQHRPSEEEQKDIRNLASFLAFILIPVLAIALYYVIGLVAFAVGPVIALILGGFFYEWMKGKAAERNYKKATSRTIQ